MVLKGKKLGMRRWRFSQSQSHNYITSNFIMAPAAILSTTLLTSAALTPSNISVSIVAVSSVGCVAATSSMYVHMITTTCLILPDVILADSSEGGGGFMYCK